MPFTVGLLDKKEMEFLVDPGTSYNILSKYKLSSDTIGKMEILKHSVEPTLSNHLILGKMTMMFALFWQKEKVPYFSYDLLCLGSQPQYSGTRFYGNDSGGN